MLQFQCFERPRVFALGVALLLYLIPQQSAHALVIDSFDVGSFTATGAYAGPPQSDSSIWGGERSVVIAQTAGLPVLLVTAVDNGSFSYTEANSGTNGTVTLTWSGGDPNLTGGGANTAFAIDVVSLTGSLTFGLTLTDGDGDVATAVFTPVAGQVNLVYFNSFDFDENEFSFADVDEIRFTVNGLTPSAGDGGQAFELGSISVAAPEPSSLALLALGGVTLCGYRRMRRNRAS